MESRRHIKPITPSEAIAAFERAFRTGSPNEVEQLLREMINVQVAVIEDEKSAIIEINKGKRLKTVPVPYGVFLGKLGEWLRESKTVVFILESNFIIAEDEPKKILRPIRSKEEAIPGRTYAILKEVAGYSRQEGLTFLGPDEVTGFENQPHQERLEKFTEGHFQLWEEHVKGCWERSARIANIYRPFVDAWVSHVLPEQWKVLPGSKRQFVNTILWALQVAVLFHDIGKLNKEWQDVVWENERKIRKHIDEQKQPIARTSPLTNPEVRRHLRKPSSHAPFAYPFIKTFLRSLLGEYRFWDCVALAVARHHSLEVTGRTKKGQIQLVEGAKDTLTKILSHLFNLSEDEQNEIEKALSKSFEKLSEGARADEPPSPSDDFYFLYCLANRMVKVCDWEDASGKIIELGDLKGEDNGSAT